MQRAAERAKITVYSSNAHREQLAVTKTSLLCRLSRPNALNPKCRHWHSQVIAKRIHNAATLSTQQLQVRLRLLLELRRDSCSFTSLLSWDGTLVRTLFPGVPACILPEGHFARP